MSNKFFEELGKKLDTFVENSEKDVETFKTKADEFAKEAEKYVESVAKDLEPVIQDIKSKFEEGIPTEKTFIFNITGNGKYKIKYDETNCSLTIYKKGSERKFTLNLNKSVVTKKKVRKIIENSVVDKKDNTLRVVIKIDLLNK